MSELKTQKNDASVQAFIDSLQDDRKKQDSQALVDIFTQASGEIPVMWGDSIIGFGQYHYRSERSRQEGDWMLTGFSPRKQNLTLYIMPGFVAYDQLLSQLGKYTTSVSCLYIKRLSDVDLTILKQLISAAFHDMKRAHGVSS